MKEARSLRGVLLRNVKASKVNGKSCRLCQEKKLGIATYKADAEMLNEMSKIMAKCRKL